MVVKIHVFTLRQLLVESEAEQDVVAFSCQV
jgi:hypothetical protein